LDSCCSSRRACPPNRSSSRAWAALPLFVSETQINAILPSITAIGLVSISVSFDGRISNAEPVKVVRSSFGVFARNGGGSGRAAAQNAVSVTELPPNSPENPAAPGDIVVLWGAGIGPVESDEVQPQPVERSEPLEVLVAGRPRSSTAEGAGAAPEWIRSTCGCRRTRRRDARFPWWPGFTDSTATWSRWPSAPPDARAGMGGTCPEALAAGERSF